MTTDDLGIVLEIAGGLSATALAFIVRSLFARMTLCSRLQSRPKADNQFPAIAYVSLTRGDWYSRQKLPAVACAAFGGIVLVSSCGLTLAKAFAPKGVSGGDVGAGAIAG